MKAATSWPVSASRAATTSGAGTRAASCIAATASVGTAPTAAHPWSAASSTSSHRASFTSSDQILVISGRL